MVHDQAFLAAIFEDTDDDAPRLVYADWLDEHGEPAYAEFIRTQCERVRVPGGGVTERQLLAREAELLSAHRREWLGPLSEPLIGVRFHRGFVRSLACDAAEFAAHAGDLFRLVPVVWSLELHWRGDDLLALSGCESLNRVIGLRLIAHDPAATAARDFVGSAHFGALQRLVVPRNNLGDAGALAIARSNHLAALRVLILDQNQIGTAGALALAGTTTLPRLAEVSLGNNPEISAAARNLLRERFGSGLGVLR